MRRGLVLAVQVHRRPGPVERSPVGPQGDGPGELCNRLVGPVLLAVHLGQDLEGLPLFIVQPHCSLEVGLGFLPRAALEPEQPAVEQDGVAERGAGSGVEQLERPLVIGLGRLELMLDLSLEVAAPGVQGLGRRAGQAGDLVGGEAAQLVQPGETGLGLETGREPGPCRHRPLELETADRRQAVGPEVAGLARQRGVEVGQGLGPASPPVEVLASQEVVERRGQRQGRRGARSRSAAAGSPRRAWQSARRRWYARLAGSSVLAVSSTRRA